MFNLPFSFTTQTIPVVDLDLPPDGQKVNSAADLIAVPLVNKSFENAVSKIAGTNIDGQLVSGFARLLAMIVEQFTFKATVEFTDGSMMDFESEKIDFDSIAADTSVTYKRMERSGKDSEGIPLPETAADLNGIIIEGGSGGNLGELIDLIGRLAVPINGGVFSKPDDNCKISLSCSNTTEGMGCTATILKC
ncbi:MAG: hypothetical protein PF630_05635 [Gammaproteobacteria bacterium]|jgi:hypothetical protein|nr:hypothetical protein [Gammaproteobacteria bacterium]